MDEQVRAEIPMVWIVLGCAMNKEVSLSLLMCFPFSFAVFSPLLDNGYSYLCLICNYEYSQAIMAEGKQHALAIGYTKMSKRNIGYLVTYWIMIF